MLRHPFFRRHWPFFVLCALFLGAYYVLIFSAAYVELKIEVERPTWFKIYWATDNGRNENMARVAVYPGKKDYGFWLGDLVGTIVLDVTPVEYAGNCRLVSLTISQGGFRPIVLQSPESFKIISASREIERAVAYDNGLSLVTSGENPSFSFPLHLEPSAFALVAEVARIIIIASLLGAVYWLAASLLADMAYVPLLLFGVLLLIAVMMVVSRENVHIDEFVHLAASRYYVSHWLPPALDDPAIVATYSPYGVTRLASPEIYYLLNGRFIHLLSVFHLPDIVAARLLNPLLFAAMLLICIRWKTPRYLAAVLLVTPQVWYAFSYCTSDGFAIFAAFLCGWQVVDGGSALHRCLRGGANSRWLGYALLAALCFSLLLVVKKTYWFFLACAGIFLLTDIFFLYATEERRWALLRLAVIIVLALLPFTGKKILDYQANDWAFPQQERAMLLKMAEKPYNPETPPAQRNPYLHLRDQGEPLSELVTSRHWFEKTFRGSFGVYGYYTMFGTDAYYGLVRWCGLGLLVWFFGSIFWYGGWYYRGQAVVVLVLSAALIAASLYHSWDDDFQPQGRYLLPIVAMLGMLLARAHAVLEPRLTAFGILAMFSLACYSFIVFALAAVGQVAPP